MVEAAISNRMPIEIRMDIDLHVDAICQAKPKLVELTQDQFESLACKSESQQNLDGEQQSTNSHVFSTSQMLHIIFSMVLLLKNAPEDKRQKFIELVKYEDNDHDTQLNILLCNIDYHWNELLGQIAGCVFIGPCKELLNRANLAGQSPLILAVQSEVKCPALLRALVLLGADPNQCDISNNNARSYARQTGIKELLAAVEEQITLDELQELQAFLPSP